MADIEIGYKGSTITSINSGGVTTLNTIGTFCEDNITVTFNKTQGEAFTPATTITTNPSITLSATTGTITAFYSGASNITPTVTPGYVSTGTAGTIRTSGTSTYQLSTVAAQTITPTTASQLAVASGRFTTGSVYVGAIPSTYVQPTGTLTISANGTYDVTEYASVSTNISEGERFAPIYKNLAFRSTLYASGRGTTSYGSYTASDISDWCNSLTSINAGQFANQWFAGAFVFENVKRIDTYGFVSGYAGNIIQQGSCSFIFPSCSSVGGGIFTQNRNIVSINFPILSSLTSSMFMSCTELTTVSLPLCKTIGQYAFYGCTRLAAINLPSCTTISAFAFTSCSYLTEISLPNCTSIRDHGFNGCIRLTTISLPLCTTIESYTFASNYSLSTIDLPLCSLISAYAFAYCSALVNIDLPMCESISYNAFLMCSSLENANLPLCTYINSSAFRSCIELTSINLPVCETVGGMAFANCSNLTEIKLPLCSIINASTFYSCWNLTTVILQSCSIISTYAFLSCYNLLSLYLLGSSTISLNNTTVFTSTPISTYTTSTGGVHGSIFVRASLYNSYLTATNWSWFSSRFVSLTDAEIEALGF